MTIEERNTARAIQDIAKEMKKTPKIDWEQRRYEIAKDLFSFHLEGFRGDAKVAARCAAAAADALIEELRKGKE